MTLTDDTPTGSELSKSDPLSIYSQLLRGELEGDEALRASQQMLSMITDTIPQAIWWKDRNCVFLGVNKFLADLAGLQPEEMIGKSDFDMPWADGGHYGATWYQDWDREVMESGQARYGIREELRMPDGSRIWIETSKVPLRSLDGEVIGVLGTFQDVTERRAAEEERKRALELLDERVQERTAALRKANENLRRGWRSGYVSRPRSANSAPTPRRYAIPRQRWRSLSISTKCWNRCWPASTDSFPIICQP